MNIYKLENVCTDIYSGGTPSTKIPEYWNGDLKWLSSGETSRDFISDTIQHITKMGVDNSSTRLAKQYSVVMACAGQGKTRGQVSYILNDMYVNQSVIVLAPNDEKINSLYLFYNLKNRYDELRGGSDASSTRGSITTTALKKLPINLPDREQQDDIVNILRVYDDLIEKNNRKIEILQDMAEELYKEWFVRFRFPGYKTAKFTDGIPEGWEVKKCGDISTIKAGGDAPKEYSETKTDKYKYPIFSNGINEDGLYGYTDRPSIKEESITISARGTVGYVCLRNEPYLPIVRLLVIVPNEDIVSNIFLYMYFKHNATEGYGTSQQQITVPYFKKKKILLPSQELVNKYTEYVELFFMDIRKLKQLNSNLTIQRDLLLPRLMSGKLEVKVS